MAVMAAMAVVAIGSQLMGASAAKKAAQAQADAARANAVNQITQIKKGQSNIMSNMLFNEQKLGLDVQRAEIDFKQKYIQRLEGYNQVRDTQLVSIGYQGRTLSSIQGIQASGDHAFDYDLKVDEANANMVKINLNLANSMSQLQLQRDYDSGNAAIEANVTAAKYGGQAASAQAEMAGWNATSNILSTVAKYGDFGSSSGSTGSDSSINPHNQGDMSGEG